MVQWFNIRSKIKSKGIPSCTARAGPELKDALRLIDIENYINLVGADELFDLPVK